MRRDADRQPACGGLIGLAFWRGMVYRVGNAMDAHPADIEELSLFLLDYTAALLGAGTHTERCVRCVNRVAEAYGYRAAVIILQKNISMSLVDGRDPMRRHTSVHRLHPVVFNFSRIGLLSALSWRAMDDRLPLHDLQREYRLIMAKGARPLWLVTLCMAAANASFCRLFGGDATAMALVFLGTLVGYSVRGWLTRKRVNHHGVVVICATLSALVASLGMRFGWGETADVALATSVLYLVPGVQIINTFMDLINGYTLNSYQRGIPSLVSIICMAVGLALTVLLVGVPGLPAL